MINDGGPTSLTRVFCRKHGREQETGWPLKSQTVLRSEQIPAAASSSWRRFLAPVAQCWCWECAGCSLRQVWKTLRNLSLWLNEFHWDKLRPVRLVMRDSRWNWLDGGRDLLGLWLLYSKSVCQSQLFEAITCYYCKYSLFALIIGDALDTGCSNQYLWARFGPALTTL